MNPINIKHRYPHQYLRYVQVDGIKMRYIDTEDARKKSVLLLIHGLGGSADSWNYNTDDLSKKARVIAIDLPGFGLSDKPRIDYTIRFYTETVAKFIGLLGIGSVSILGSSLGGQIAAEIAINYPTLVRRLVLVSPAGSPPRNFKGSQDLRKYMQIVNAKDKTQIKKLFDGYRRQAGNSFLFKNGL